MIWGVRDISTHGLIDAKIRLDRALATEDWMDIFPSFTVNNIVWDSSDHMPILIKACKFVRDADVAVSWDSRPFKFEAK